MFSDILVSGTGRDERVDGLEESKFLHGTSIHWNFMTKMLFVRYSSWKCLLSPPNTDNGYRGQESSRRHHQERDICCIRKTNKNQIQTETLQ